MIFQNKNNLKEKNGLIILICSLIAFFAASGSIYFNTRIIGIAKIDILFAILTALIVWQCRGRYITLTGMHLWIGILLIIYFVNNGTNLSIFDYPLLLLFPASFVFVLTSLRMPIEWFEIEISILKGIYIFYAIYTILMRFFPVLLDISIRFYQMPQATVRMMEQYSNGCMPGFTTHYSTNGMLLAVGGIIFFTDYIHCRKKSNLFFSILFTIALLLTGKRAHVIFTALAIFVGFYVNASDDKKNRRINILLIVIAVIVFLFIIVQYVPSLATFVSRFAETEEEGDITLGRTSVWRISLDIFKANPIIGIGWGQFINKGYLSYNAHNIYVQLLCETGILGSIAYYCFFIYMFLKTWSLLKSLRENNEVSFKTRMLIFSLSYQVFFLLYGFTGNPLYEQIMYIPYFFACSITLNVMAGRFDKETNEK